MSELMFCVYRHTAPNNKSYIGQTNNYNGRTTKHKNSKTQCTAFANAIKKYTWEAFTHEILEEGLTLDEANFWEDFYINEHNTLYPHGYNLITGGKNRVPTKESRLRMSVAHKGKPFTEMDSHNLAMARKARKPHHSEETKQKIAESNRGQKRSEETRRNIGLSKKGCKLSEERKVKLALSRVGMPPTFGMLGKKHSEETKQRMSAAQKARPPISEETRLRLVEMGKRNIGKKQSPETCLKKSIAGKGRIVSEETRRKLSEAQKNITDETRLKLSASAKNISDKTRLKRSLALRARPPASEETRLKISKTLTGKKHSPETKQRMSEAHKRRLAAKANLAFNPICDSI